MRNTMKAWVHTGTGTQLIQEGHQNEGKKSQGMSHPKHRKLLVSGKCSRYKRRIVATGGAPSRVGKLGPYVTAKWTPNVKHVKISQCHVPRALSLHETGGGLLAEKLDPKLFLVALKFLMFVQLLQTSCILGRVDLATGIAGRPRGWFISR